MADVVSGVYTGLELHQPRYTIRSTAGVLYDEEPFVGISLEAVLNIPY